MRHAPHRELVEVYPGLLLALLREPSNAHDSNAIAVYNREMLRIGYVPRYYAKQLAPLMDAGETTVAFVTNVFSPTLAMMNIHRFSARKEDEYDTTRGSTEVSTGCD
jgi:hypothetical protein